MNKKSIWARLCLTRCTINIFVRPDSSISERRRTTKSTSRTLFMSNQFRLKAFNTWSNFVCLFLEFSISSHIGIGNRNDWIVATVFFSLSFSNTFWAITYFFSTGNSNCCVTFIGHKTKRRNIVKLWFWLRLESERKKRKNLICVCDPDYSFFSIFSKL